MLCCVVLALIAAFRAKKNDEKDASFPTECAGGTQAHEFSTFSSAGSDGSTFNSAGNANYITIPNVQAPPGSDYTSIQSQESRGGSEYTNILAGSGAAASVGYGVGDIENF